MKIKWAAIVLCLLASLILLLGCASADEASTVELPWQLAAVEKQAFYRVENISRAILPPGTERIEEQAFAYSGLKTVNLPESIDYIALDAFEGCADLVAECAEGSYAYSYCTEKGITTAVPPLEIRVLQGKNPRIVQSSFETALANLAQEIDKPARSEFFTAADSAAQSEQLTKILRRGADLVLVDLADKKQAAAVAQTLSEAEIPFMFFNAEPAADVAKAHQTIFVGCKNGGKADKEELSRTCAQIAANYFICGSWLEGLDYPCEDGWRVLLSRLTGVKIGIDPGHQRKANSAKEPVAPGSSTKKAKVSTGTYGRTTKTSEYVRVLEIAKVLKSELEAQGAQVYMTRETHDVNISNIERAKMMNELGVDLVLRIHCDGASVQSAKGITLYVPKSGSVAADSYRAAKLILPAMISQTGAKSRGVKKSNDYTGLNWSTVPSILVECGFMTNPTEDRKLADPKYQLKLATGMVEGIAQYMGR